MIYEFHAREKDYPTIFFLRKKYLERSRYTGVPISELAPESGLTLRELEELLIRLEMVGVIKWGRSKQGRFPIVQKSIVELGHQIDNRPPKDYWEDLFKWFRSKPWSVPFAVAIFGLPALVQWIEMLKAVFLWIFPAEK